ncbi:MAG: sulfotransferase [Gammaproteobacteria bacterium]|nr:sulfotransferase [Gammaproteobacteria bacterium]
MTYSAKKLSELLATDGADSALGHCVEALAESPGDAGLHHVYGRVLNNLGRLEEALHELNQAIGIDTENSLMLAHRGHILLRLQRRDEAVDDFQNALALESSQVVALGGLASICLAVGRTAEATALLVRLTECDPGKQMHWLNLGLARHESGLLHEAEEALRTALELLPGDPDTSCALASVLQSQGRLDEASEWFARVLHSQPTHPQAIAAMAGIREILGRPDEAMDMLRPMLTGETGEVAPAIGLAAAQLLQKSGDTKDAVAQLEAVLSNDGTDALQRSTAHFLLSAIMDKKGEYDKAFVEAEKANRIRSGRYSEKHQEHCFARSREIFDSGVLQNPGSVAMQESPVIFIVGMPRSGTSLVEQILDSHSNIYGAGELDFVGRIVAGLVESVASRRPYPDCLEEMKPSQIEALSADLRGQYATLAGTARFVTDKMWQNFEFLGLIQLILPAARVIHCRRDSRDTGLSCFLQGFGVAGPPFSYSLPGIAHYYRQYMEMMNYWQRTLTLPILDLQYEELVTDPEVQIRRLLEFLGLEWEPACLEFHRNRRMVKTASSDQVRQPLYRSSIGRHRNYSVHMDDFFAALQARGDG